MRISVEILKYLISLGDINAHKAYVFFLQNTKTTLWTYNGLFYILNGKQWYQCWNQEVYFS